MPTPLATILADYAAIQYRPPPPLNSTHVTSYLSLEPSQVVSAIEAEAYTLNVVNAVIREYQTAFGRVPDQAGAAYWVQQIGEGNLSLSNLSLAFASSPEFLANHGVGPNFVANGSAQAIALVQSLYTEGLDRPPDPSGLNFWANSGLTATQLLQAFSQSSEAQTAQAPHIIQFQNLEVSGTEPTTGSLFDIPAPATFELTPGVDTFTTSDAGAIFNALPVSGTLGLTNTLNTGDNLQDTKGDGTLNFTAVLATAGLAANPPYATGVTLNGISTLNITNQANFLGVGALPAGFQGNVTGLTTVNDNASLAGVQLGGPNQGLNTPLNTVNISGFAGAPSISSLGVLPVFAADIAASKGSTANTLTVNLNGNIGTTKGLLPTGGAAIISIASDAAAGTVATPNLSYGTQIYNTGTNTATYLQLEAQSGGFVDTIVAGILGAASVDGTLNFVFKGGGTLGVGQDVAGDHQLAQNIDLSGTTGSVFITGATAGVATNAMASAANPGALFGSKAGFLDNGAVGIFNLKTVELGSGPTFLDVSDATAAQVAALTTTPGTLVSLDNEIVVNDAVATTAIAATFANIKGFEILGIGGPALADGAGGTIDMSKLPASIDAIDYMTAASGSVSIINQVNPLTVNLEDNTTAVQTLKVTNSSGVIDGFLDVVIGNTAHAAGDAIGDITVLGDGQVTLTAKGGVGALDSTGGLLLTPTLGGAEHVTITGDTNIGVGVNTAQGAIADTTGGALNINNLTVTIDNTGATLFEEGIAGTVLNFATDAGANGGVHAPFIAYADNAVTIDASASGGFLTAFGDANFIKAITVAGSQGDTITGAATPVGLDVGGGNIVGDAFGGSIGNDILTSKNAGGLSDFIFTEGGSDLITLAAGHTGVDHVAFYAGNGFATAPGAVAISSVATSISEAFGGFEFANPGMWGIAAGGSSQAIDTLLPTNGTGTSADNSTINNFAMAQDVLDFSGQAWGSGALVLGLTADTAGGLKNVGVAGDTSATGTAVIAREVAPGGSIAGTGADMIILSQGSFLNANAVAGALANGSYTINHSVLALGTESDFLVAYQGLDGNAHIADLHVQGTLLGSTNTFTDTNVHVSDMATLVGVSLPTLAANAGHIHLVT
mgnify:CR=1 FL=1